MALPASLWLSLFSFPAIDPSDIEARFPFKTFVIHFPLSHPRFPFLLPPFISAIDNPGEDFAFQHHHTHLLTRRALQSREAPPPSTQLKHLDIDRPHNVWRSVSPATTPLPTSHLPSPSPPLSPPSCAGPASCVVRRASWGSQLRTAKFDLESRIVLQCNAPKHRQTGRILRSGQRAADAREIFLKCHLLSSLQRPPRKRWRSSESWLLLAAVPEEC